MQYGLHIIGFAIIQVKGQNRCRFIFVVGSTNLTIQYQNQSSDIFWEPVSDSHLWTHWMQILIFKISHHDTKKQQIIHATAKKSSFEQMLLKQGVNSTYARDYL